MLADAILTEDSKRGLALLVGDIPEAVKTQAQILRREAMSLDEKPLETTLRQSLSDLTPADARVQNP